MGNIGKTLERELDLGKEERNSGKKERIHKEKRSREGR